MFGATIAIVDDQDVLADEAIAEEVAPLSSDSFVDYTPGPDQLRRLPSQRIVSTTVGIPPLDSPGQACAKEGFLSKIGGQVKSWKARYFRLLPGRLAYYPDGESLSNRARLGAILLPGATISVFSSDVHAGHPYCFGLSPLDTERQYVLEADSAAHRQEWIAALQQATTQRIKLVPESVRESFLTKQGAVRKSWKRRFCILTRAALKYYPSFDEMHECLGNINLGGGFIVGCNDEHEGDGDEGAAPGSPAAAAAAPPASPSSKQFVANHPYNFSIRAHGASRIYIFCTTTKADRDGWIQALNEVQRHVKI